MNARPKFAQFPVGLGEFPEKRWLNHHFSSNFKGFFDNNWLIFWPPPGFPIQIKSVPFFPTDIFGLFFLCAGILKALPSPPPVVFLNFPECLHPFAIDGWFFLVRGQDRNWRPLPKVVFMSHHLDPD